MITPAYALTATERVLPRLALDFTTAVLDPRVTVSRALNTATVQNADGSVSIVNADLPRFDFANGVCRGLLIEEARTNVLLNSVFAGAVAGTPGTAPTNWLDLQSTGTIASVSAGIYAAGNAIRITNTGTRRAFYRSQALLANTTYTYSLKITVHSTPVAGFPRIQDCMNLSGGPAGSTVTYQLNGATATATTPIPNGQTSTVVAIIAVAATAGNVEVRWGLGVGSTIDGDVSIQMPQLEAGAFATSYIPTTTTSVTRNADGVSMTGTNFSSWYNASEGAFEVAGITSPRTTGAAVAEHALEVSGTLRMVRGAGSVSLGWNIGSGTFQSFGVSTANFSFKSVAAYKATNNAASLNGSAPLTDAGSTYGTPTLLGIGCNTGGGQQFNGHIKSVRYWPQRVINAETQAFSK